MLTRTEKLADSLGMPADEIAGFAQARYGAHPDDDQAVAVAVRGDLDSWDCVRSVPACFWPAILEKDPFVCRCNALGGREHAPSPTCPPNR